MIRESLGSSNITTGYARMQGEEESPGGGVGGGGGMRVLGVVGGGVGGFYHPTTTVRDDSSCLLADPTALEFQDTPFSPSTPNFLLSPHPSPCSGCDLDRQGVWLGWGGRVGWVEGNTV